MHPQTEASVTALYARVSSSRQEREDTIQSQLEELRARARADGEQTWEELIDEGYSRDNLARPALDRLRDMATQGAIPRVYIQCPDRLAAGAKLIVLLEEFQRQGAKVVFLKGAVEDNPEGKLLMHMQGAIAEYERTKIGERTRRGKLHWARQGALMGGYVPFGYKYIARDREQNRRATLELDEGQAGVVRQMYKWLLEERMSCRGIAKRLTEQRVPTPKGRWMWRPSTVNRMLKESAYKGVFYYHRAEGIEPARHTKSNPYRKQSRTGRRIRPVDEWIRIPVPAVIDESTWEAAQRQLRENFLRSPRNNVRHQYLLRTILRCPKCGATFVGSFSHGKRRYHCNRVDRQNSTDGKRCGAGWVDADPVEEVVWQAITELLHNPEALIDDYRRRLAASEAPSAFEQRQRQIEAAIKRLSIQQDRLTDAYKAEAIDLTQYKAEMDKVRAIKQEREKQLAELSNEAQRQEMQRGAMANLETFCHTVKDGLDNLTFEERQSLLCLLIESAIIRENKIRIEVVLPFDGPNHSVGLCPQCANPCV